MIDADADWCLLILLVSDWCWLMLIDVTPESDAKENTTYVGAHPRPLDVLMSFFGMRNTWEIWEIWGRYNIEIQCNCTWKGIEEMFYLQRLYLSQFWNVFVCNAKYICRDARDVCTGKRMQELLLHLDAAHICTCSLTVLHMCMCICVRLNVDRVLQW